MASSATTTFYLSTCLFLSSLLVLSFHVQPGRCMTLNPVRNVNITNYLGKGIKLKLHCKSKDDDIGDHVLDFGESLVWSFRSNFFFANTLFWCESAWTDWMNIHGTFSIYDARRDDGRCAEKCWWAVETDGLFSHNDRSGEWELIYYIKRKQIPALNQLTV